jgi:hypothetical protein
VLILKDYIRFKCFRNMSPISLKNPKRYLKKKDQKFIYLARVCKCRLLGFKLFQIFVEGHINFLVSKLDNNPNIRQLKYS